MEGESQFTDTGTRKDSSFKQSLYRSERYTDSGGGGGSAPSASRDPTSVAVSNSASLAWVLRTRHQPASLALRKQEEEEHKRCKALSDSYELSTDLQDKKVSPPLRPAGWAAGALHPPHAPSCFYSPGGDAGEEVRRLLRKPQGSPDHSDRFQAVSHEQEL